ncbi:MAG: galactokinase [Alkalispirochaeta sp.]
MRVRRSEFLQIVHDGSYRLERVEELFSGEFDSHPTVLVSAPGRSEIIGNHTDHNNGRVVAAAIDMDTIVLAGPSRDGISRLHSLGWERTFVDDPSRSLPDDADDTTRLMRGVAEGLRRSDYKAPAYNAVIDSRVLPGSGLSSSAALELSLAGVHEALSGEEIPPIERARIGKYAENEFMGKPSGLMDQLAVSLGGAVAIDFADPEEVRYHSIDLDFRRSGYQLAIVDTGGSHADLTDRYAAVPREMGGIARELGVTTLAETSKKKLLGNLSFLRDRVGDRAVLRAFHFFDEQERVLSLIDAVNTRHDDRVLTMMNESGDSSWTMLQNVFPGGDGREQSLALGLTLTREYFRERGATGACRVHGGGFAGTILAVVPEVLYDEYRHVMDRAFGDHATKALTIRKEGVIVTGF